MGHLRASALPSETGPLGPEYHAHIATWIEEVLKGALESFEEQIKEALMTDAEKAKTLSDIVDDGHLQKQDSGCDYLTD